MKVVDIHPEELIDKLHSGDLTSAERERLDAHLAQCSSCRFEIGVRADLEQEAPLFEQRPQLTSAGQQAAPRALPLAAGVTRSAPRVPSVRPRIRRRWRLGMLAAALVLCAGGATAAVVAGAVVAPNWLPWASELKAATSALATRATRRPRTSSSERRSRPPRAAVAPVPSVTATALRSRRSGRPCRVADRACVCAECSGAGDSSAFNTGGARSGSLRARLRRRLGAVQRCVPERAGRGARGHQRERVRAGRRGSSAARPRSELVRGCQPRAPRRQRRSRCRALPITASSLPELFGESAVARAARSVALGSREPERSFGRLRPLPCWRCSGAER